METRDVRLTREEWHALRAWMDDSDYPRRPGETLNDWRIRTETVAYAYAQVIEAGCDHRQSPTEPYCDKCGMLMDWKD